MGESRSTEPAAKSPDLAAALAPASAGPAAPMVSVAGAMGNAAFSRTLARKPTATGASVPDDPAAYALGLGDQMLRDKLAPGQPVSKEIGAKFKASTPKSLGRIDVPLVPGFFAHFGVTASVAAAAGARVNLGLSRSEQGDGYADTVTVNGSANANGLLFGSMSAGLGVGFRGLNVTAHASGSLRLDAKGTANLSGEIKRASASAPWAGRIDVDGELRGSLTAAASGYFQWQVLWWDGRFGEFRIKEWRLGEAAIKVKGWADLNGASDIRLTPDFSPPERPQFETKGQTTPPPGKAPGTAVATKRFDVPRDPPRSGLAAFEAMVARDTAPPAAEPPREPPAEPAPAAAPPQDPTAPPQAVATPPAGPADAELPGSSVGFVTVPGEPAEGG